MYADLIDELDRQISRQSWVEVSAAWTNLNLMLADTWHAVDTINYNVNLYIFANALNKSPAGALFWAVTVVNSQQDTPNVRLAVGSNASCVWWVNGQKVAGIYGDRQTVADDGVSKRLTLKKGPNVSRCATINGSGATDFCGRFLDADDKPVTNLALSLGETAH